MSLFTPSYLIDVQWLDRISNRLESFNRVSNTTHNCICPFCVKEAPTKKRKFYFYTKSNNLNVICHKCGYSRSFWNYIESEHSDLFEDYKREQLRDVLSTRRTPIDRRQKKEIALSQIRQESGIDITKLNMVRCDKLSETHTANRYLTNRCLADRKDLFYYTEDFKSLAEEVTHDIEGTERLEEDEPRLIIPLFHRDGTLKAIQGRSFNPKAYLKYITIKTAEDVDKIFGLERLDNNKTVYAVEGPIDSLFIDNCVAVCDSKLTKANADVYIWDNEPRNKNIVKFMESAIEDGKRLVIWPVSPDDKLDINDLILQGLDKKDLQNVIESCTYEGLKAKLKLNSWRKV